MSDGTLGNALYPNGPASTPQGVSAGLAGTPAAAAPAMRDVPAEQPSALAGALYGGGQAATPQGPQGMSGESWRGVATRDLPAAAQSDSVQPDQRPDSGAQHEGGEASVEGGQAAAEGGADPVMAEFEALSGEMGLVPAEQQRLVEVGVKIGPK